MKWYFRFVIKDGEIVDEVDITPNINSDMEWRGLMKLWEGEHSSTAAIDLPDGVLYYAEVDDNDL